MASWFRSLARRLRGERRSASRHNAEHVQIVNRQYAAAVRLSHKLNRPPEELLGYHIADRILSRREH